MPSIQRCVSMIPLQCLCILRLSCLARPSRYFYFPLKGLRHDGTSCGSPCPCRVGRPRPAWPFGQGPVRVLDHNGASAAGDCFALTASLLPGDWNCYSEKKRASDFRLSPNPPSHVHPSHTLHSAWSVQHVAKPTVTLSYFFTASIRSEAHSVWPVQHFAKPTVSAFYFSQQAPIPRCILCG